MMLYHEVFKCSAAKTEHPLIASQQGGCPYRFTSYRNYEHSLVSTPFGLQEWVQRDASLMSSNINVMEQYALSLHRTASEILQSVFGRYFFPSAAIKDAAPVLHVLWASTPNGPAWWFWITNYLLGPPVFRVPGLSSTPVRW